VLNHYENFIPMIFMELPLEEGPWIKAHKENSREKQGQNIISKESMLEYYSGLLLPLELRDPLVYANVSDMLR
jgi:hypothetical protein